ncbi:SDR family oxidoreductase [Acidipila sp. EB88]|uniref:SDR family NAD(P)-dependent oxidoreductase n=1 Tax=Acidipila sp. EB88 TaxID=2305226 RepID=UPI000F5FF59A|nr:SDR family NAD(P)-dependent oxidoreductase [Acidipila sp. EB88]RRA48404.1 SDR family NAD(P)-dependent oxidoreductase [Acidipila sp. EB88]
MTSKGLALVTGASSGIGYHLAKQLAEDGYDLVISGEEQGLTGKASADFKALGVNVTSYVGDLTQFQSNMDLWHTVEAAGQPLAIACINAGLGQGGMFADTPLTQELEIVNLNCGATVHMAKHVVKQMRGSGGGRILFTASIVSEMIAPGEAVYAASKAFVFHFAKSLRYELKDTGITVTALQPGPTATNFFNASGAGDTKVGTEGKEQNQPDEVARQGLKALFAGEEHVYASSLTTKIEGALMGLVPEALQSAMHKGMMEPAKK